MQFFCSNDVADLDIMVPEEFAILLKVSLSRMVAAKCLSPELINLDFWRRIPNKFKGIRYYEDSKKKNREVNSFFFILSYVYVTFTLIFFFSF